MGDVFDVQDEITLAVVDPLKVKLLGEEKAAILKRGTDNTEACELYLRGLFYWNKRTGDNIRKAIDLFQQAIERDPNYALDYVGLADCYVVLEEHSGVPVSETLPKARAAAKRAPQIDDSLAEAHTSLAYTYQICGAGRRLRKNTGEMSDSIRIIRRHTTGLPLISLRNGNLKMR